MNLLLPLLLAAAPARASDSLAYPTNTYRLWSWTAVEGLPNHQGESQFRAQEQLAAEVEATRSLFFYGIGAVGISPTASVPDTFELYRLHATWRRPGMVLDAGRLSRWDVRGRHHLDGVAGAFGSGTLTGEAWLGRLWHPETWQTGNTVVAGGEVGFKPQPGLHGQAGAELRAGEDEVNLRLHGAAAAWGARGSRGLAMVEGQPGEGLRATVDGSLPVMDFLEVELGGGWEGLEPASLPIAMDSPQAWLGAEGYGTASAGARVRRGMLWAQALGGPTFHPADSGGLGGDGRVEVGVRTQQGWEVGVAGVGAGIGHSWVAGGTLGGAWAREELQLRAEGGLFRYMPIGGGLSEVAEGRLKAQVPLLDKGTLRTTRRLVLSGELAAGTDRILSRWMRGGIALHGVFAGPRTGEGES